MGTEDNKLGDNGCNTKLVPEIKNCIKADKEGRWDKWSKQVDPSIASFEEVALMGTMGKRDRFRSTSSVQCKWDDKASTGSFQDTLGGGGHSETLCKVFCLSNNICEYVMYNQKTKFCRIYSKDSCEEGGRTSSP